LRLKSLICSSDDIQHASALDELFFFQALPQNIRIVHEEGGLGPDFRIYEGDQYIVAVEVCSLLENREWDQQQRRHARIADGLNKRIPLEAWFVHFDVVQLDRQPSIKRLASWVRHQIGELPSHATVEPDSSAPHVMYVDDGVQLDFTFIKRTSAIPPRPTDRIVGGGQLVGGFVDSYLRIRSALEKKVQKRYDTRGKPLAIAMGIWDTFATLDEVDDALFGNESVVVATGQVVRSNNGFFGRTRERPKGKHQEISCVFVRQRWYPWSSQAAILCRYDNPFAEFEFPLDIISADYRYQATRDPSAVRMKWYPTRPAESYLT
jgi:hypothetical protein